MKILPRFLPLSLRVRFLLATAAVVLIISLAYGLVAVIGYGVSFDKTTFRLLRGESNLYYSLAIRNNGNLEVKFPDQLNQQTPTMAFIYSDKGKLLWAQHDLPMIAKQIKPEWLSENGFHEIASNYSTSHALAGDDLRIQQRLKDVNNNNAPGYQLTHFVAVNLYPATARMPPLTIVVIDKTPIEVKHSYQVWNWFGYVILANCLLVVPLLWLAAWWSLRPIESLAREVRELEKHNRDHLNLETTKELNSLVRNLNRLLKSERERYDKYRTTLTDLTHSLKTPLAVLQTALRSLRTQKMAIDEAEPIMLEQISRISQQIGYYLHRASMRDNAILFNRELHAIAPLLDNLCSALNKVYQRKGVNLTLDISPEIIFIGEKNDFMEVMGNILDNACKYCLEFVEISAMQSEDALHLIVEDDGPGIPESKRSLVFDRGQRVDTLQPGQGIGLSITREIVEQYDGKILITSSALGGARIEVIFAHQDSEKEVD